MDIKVKINISIQNGYNIATSITLGPSEDSKPSSEEQLLKQLEWPYNYSTVGALLPSISQPA